MKKMKKFFTIAIVLFAFSATTFAQVSATATASATIITPLTITWASDMNFGNLYVSPTTGGTVVLTPAGARSVTSGVSLPVVPGTVTSASFTVSGLADATYSITLPAGVATLAGPGLPMTVDTWTSSPTPTGTLTGGTETLTVGGTLHVAAAQAIGSYISGNFTITVNYN